MFKNIEKTLKYVAYIVLVLSLIIAIKDAIATFDQIDYIRQVYDDSYSHSIIIPFIETVGIGYVFSLICYALSTILENQKKLLNQ